MEHILLHEIREALKRIRKFPEKVIKYLWDDAFKMNRDSLFAAECNSFDAVTAMYRSKSDKDPLSQIINQSVYTEMLNRMNNLA